MKTIESVPERAHEVDTLDDLFALAGDDLPAVACEALRTELSFVGLELDIPC